MDTEVRAWGAAILARGKYGVSKSRASLDGLRRFILEMSPLQWAELGLLSRV